MNNFFYFLSPHTLFRVITVSNCEYFLLIQQQQRQQQQQQLVVDNLNDIFEN